MRRSTRRTLDDRRIKHPRFVAPPTHADWTAALAYAVGLIATDGCLSKDGKTVVQTSKDRQLLEVFRNCIGSQAPIAWNQRAYRVQVSDVGLYMWLETLGLTPRKSLTLGSVKVPDRLFFDFARGLLDGDGSILTPVVVPNPRRYPDRLYQQLRVLFHSASEAHLTWLQAELKRLLNVSGWMTLKKKSGYGTPLHVLRYSKHEGMALLNEIYRDPFTPRLDRKWRIWNEFCVAGRPTRIWTKRAGVMEPEDIRVSNTRGRKPVRVQIPPPAQLDG